MFYNILVEKSFATKITRRITIIIIKISLKFVSIHLSYNKNNVKYPLVQTRFK